jgi:hypothetical protein
MEDYLKRLNILYFGTEGVVYTPFGVKQDHPPINACVNYSSLPQLWLLIGALRCLPSKIQILFLYTSIRTNLMRYQY